MSLERFIIQNYIIILWTKCASIISFSLFLYEDWKSGVERNYINPWSLCSSTHPLSLLVIWRLKEQHSKKLYQYQGHGVRQRIQYKFTEFKIKRCNIFWNFNKIYEVRAHEYLYWNNKSCTVCTWRVTEWEDPISSFEGLIFMSIFTSPRLLCV